MNGLTKVDIVNSPDLSEKVRTNLGQTVTSKDNLKFTTEPELENGL